MVLAIEGYEVMLFAAQMMPAVFCLLFGACLGSLANVLVYRMPRGLNVVTPPSACPSCHTRLTWRENIPVLGWLLLRGRCRFCKSTISPEYPIVEAFVAIVFFGIYVLWFIVPDNATIGGLSGWHIGALKPDWASTSALGLAQGWPLLVMILLLVFGLTVMTLVDAKTFTIPLSLTWICAAAGLIAHTAAAMMIQYGRQPMPALPGGWLWAIPTPPMFGNYEVVIDQHKFLVTSNGWWWIGATLGATLGLGAALALVKLGLIRRSFEDYEQWERDALAKAEAAKSNVPSDPFAASVPSPPATESTDDPTALWIAYPHARREMVKEMAFLGPVVLLGALGAWLAQHFAQPDLRAVSAGMPAGAEFVGTAAASAPLWLYALCGSLMGYLIGGGVVWLVRIFGTLGFGKEAMGMGDVHLMAAVGACLGWIDATLAFFVAAFVGMAWTIASMLITRGGMKRTMPYGPYLAIATMIVMLGKPGMEWVITKIGHFENTLQLP